MSEDRAMAMREGMDTYERLQWAYAEIARLRRELAAQTGAMAAEIGRLAGLLDECRDLLLVFVVEGRLDHGQAAELLDKLPNWPPTPGEAGGGRER